MMSYTKKSKAELALLQEKIKTCYEAFCNEGLALDLSRGKPSSAQLDLSMPMIASGATLADCKSESGFDCRNYGLTFGLPEMQAFWSEVTGIPAEQILVGGNASLSLMYDSMARAMLYGVVGSERPWCKEEEVKFLCPSPGYDRHFSICESLGITMITVPMTSDGPDMDIVEELVAKDPMIKGIWCVPKYANPTGITYTDDVVRRLAKMETAAPDFRIFWDNAYIVHDFYQGKNDTLLNIFDVAKEVGTENRIFYFTSSSKLTFPGAGVAIMAASKENLAQIKPIFSMQTIGHDKLNQLRHLAFLKNKDTMTEHMKKHAAIVAEKFAIVLDILDTDLGGLDIATYTRPNGGYFISLDLLPGTAKRVYNLCKDAGVTLTSVGATFPYGKDPEDKNLRLAPTFPNNQELALAVRVLTCAIRLASLEQLLDS